MPLWGEQSPLDAARVIVHRLSSLSKPNFRLLVHPSVLSLFSRARLGVILCARRTHALRAFCFPGEPRPSRFTVPPLHGASIKSSPWPWEQNPLAFRVPREKREQKTEDFIVYQNSVDLMGFLGSDAESRNTRDGVPLSVLSLATKRSWKDSKGEWQSQTEWHRVTCFGQVAEFAASLKKGAHIHITGYLRSREIEKNGTGRGKKSGAKTTARAWEVRAIRIAKLDRTVQEDPSTDIPANDPAS